MQILVLGPHRSGTSLVTRLINMMGAYCFGEGISIGANEENPKGFWERRDVIEANDALLDSMNAKWDDPIKLNLEEIADTEKGSFLRRFSDILLNLDAHRPWVIKDPRLCLTLPLVKPLLEVPVVVYVSRSPLECAASLQTRNGFPLYYGLALWEYYAVAALNAALDLPHVHISYEDLLFEPVKSVENLFHRLQECGVSGVKMPTSREVEAFVDPNLWRERIKDKRFSESCLTAWQQQVYNMLQGSEELNKKIAPSPLSLSILREGYKYFQANLNISEKERNDLAERLAEVTAEVEHLRRTEKERNDLAERLAEVTAEVEHLRRTEKERNDLAERLAEVSAELEEMHTTIDLLNLENRDRRLLIDTLMAVLYEGNEEELSDTDRLRSIACRIGALQRQQHMMAQDLMLLESYIRDLERILRAIRGSLTWRQASRMAALVARLTRRTPSRIMEDAERIFAAFDHWCRARH